MEGTVQRKRKGAAGGAQEDSSQGILRFYTDDAPGFQISPPTVLACSLLFIGLVVIMHIWGKFTA